jgi:predicted dinucleotide-binding enzyme
MTANDSERFADKYSHHIPNLANSSTRTALAIAGDDGEAKARVAIVNDLGFDAVDAGALTESWTSLHDSSDDPPSGTGPVARP